MLTGWQVNAHQGQRPARLHGRGLAVHLGLPAGEVELVQLQRPGRGAVDLETVFQRRLPSRRHLHAAQRPCGWRRPGRDEEIAAPGHGPHRHVLKHPGVAVLAQPQAAAKVVERQRGAVDVGVGQRRVGGGYNGRLPGQARQRRGHQEGQRGEKRQQAQGKPAVETAATDAKSACADCWQPPQGGFALVAATSVAREPAVETAATSARSACADCWQPPQGGFALVAATVRLMAFGEASVAREIRRQQGRGQNAQGLPTPGELQEEQAWNAAPEGG